jgi:tetratricopeptide (TPR) repeat protein
VSGTSNPSAGPGHPQPRWMIAVTALACLVAVALLAIGIARPKSPPRATSPERRAASTEDLTRSAAHLAQGGKLSEATAVLASAKARDPQDASIFVTRAQLLSQLGRSKEAMDDIRAAHKLVPDNSSVTFELLRIAPSFVSPAEKESFARLAIKQAPEQALSHYYLGLALVETNDPKRYPEAIAAFEQGIALAPNQQLLPLELGKLNCRLGSYLRAAAWLESSWQLIEAHEADGTTPPDEVAHQKQTAAFWMSEAYRRLGRLTEAKSMAERAEKYGALVREIQDLQVRSFASPPDPQAAARLKEIQARRR